MMKTHFAFSLLCCLAFSACATSSSSSTATLAGDWQPYEANQTPITHPKASLRFDDQQQRFHAYAGCNQLFGTYQHQPPQLTIGPVASTLMMCEPTHMTAERQLADALAHSSHYRIQHNQLELLNAQGQVILKARR